MSSSFRGESCNNIFYFIIFNAISDVNVTKILKTKRIDQKLYAKVVCS